MDEITVTRLNHLVDPRLHVWAWQIPAYLFLGGLVAGMMAITGWLLLAGRGRRGGSVLGLLPAASLALLGLGLFALFLDLEHKPFFWRLYTTFQPSSPMSWGAWILLVVVPALAAAFLLHLPGRLRGRWRLVDGLAAGLGARPRVVRAVAAVNIGLGGALGIYTGILLSALGARPLWNSALLGPLFLVSGLSSAAAFVHLVARDRTESRSLARADNGFLQAELVILALLLVGLRSSTEVHARAAGLLLGGPFTAVFWVGVVGLGLVLPLFLQSLAVAHRIRHTPVAPLLVLAGGLLLRIVVVDAGQLSHWIRP